MGMPRIELRLQMFRGDWDQIWSQMRLLWMMEGLVRVNQTHLRQFDAFKERGLIERSYPPLYRSGLHYETEKGTEIWPDLPSLLSGTMGRGRYPGHWGDCLPISAIVLRRTAGLSIQALPIGMINVGDVIAGENGWTKVLAHAITGTKPILGFLFKQNSSMLYCSPSHLLFGERGGEIRAEKVRIGMKLRRQVAEWSTLDGPIFDLVNSEVIAIGESADCLCCDITTDTGRFWLPESGVIVHNCEDLACVRTAELRELPEHYARRAPWDPKKIERADPRFPQEPSWAGWQKVKGGIKAKPFAKWRRGPRGNYHYHALTLLPDGRLEDPSLVLGMGREAEFSESKMAEKLKAGAPVTISYAKTPDVMVVDPEKPSGYAGGIAQKIDAKIIDELRKGLAPEGAFASLGDPEAGAYIANEIPLGDGEFDVDKIIGWSRAERRFSPRSDEGETRRLLGYARH